MKAKNIEKINEAIYVLRNFIDLSSELLPYLTELIYSKKLSEEDQKDREEIIEQSFNYITDGKHSKNSSKKQLIEFKKEHRRLKNNWKIIDAN